MSQSERNRGIRTGSIILASWIFLLCAYLAVAISEYQNLFVTVYDKVVGLHPVQRLLLAPGRYGWIIIGAGWGIGTLVQDRFLPQKSGNRINLISLVVSLVLVVLVIFARYG